MTAIAQHKVDELTDDAIKKRITLIERLVKTRIQNRDEIQGEIERLTLEKAGLIEVQIERLKAQLPAKEQS